MTSNPVIDLMLDKISEHDFIVRFGADPRDEQEAVHREIKQALVDKSPARAEGAVFLAHRYGLAIDWAVTLCKLLCEDWHFEHENIAEALQDIRSPLTVECLFHAATQQFEYLSYNDSTAFARKCIWALHDIGTAEAVEKLKLLVLSSRYDVRQYAAESRTHLKLLTG